MEFPIVILRIGLGIVFVLTGFLILKDKDKWVHMLPVWFIKLVPSARSFMISTASFDLGVGIWLLSGLYTGYAAIVAALHLMGVLVISGRHEFHEVYRDIGLFFASAALAAHYFI